MSDFQKFSINLGNHKNLEVVYSERAIMSLFTGLKEFEELEKEYLKLQEAPTRIRYDIPTYEKFYSIYQYDRLKFRELMNDWLKSKEGENRTLETLRAKQEEVVNVCYVKDERGKPKRDCDEKHIFRCRILQKLHEEIFQEIMFKRMGGKLLRGDFITICYEEKQAEIKDSWQLSIQDRVKAHIKLLRKLRGEV